MSYANFKPLVWAEIIDRELRKNLVFGVLANRAFEGLIKGAGDSVKIPRITNVRVGDYTGVDIDFEKDDGAEQVIHIDKSKYFALTMDDVDKAQARNGVLDLRVQNAIYQMSDAVDMELAGLYTKAKNKVVAKIGTDKITDKIIDLSVQMDKDNVPTANRWLVVSPEVYGQIIKEVPTISKGENTFGVHQSYYLGSWGGFQIFKSNNVKLKSKKYHCMAGVTQGLTLAMQLSNIEAGRHEKSFGDYVKGLNLFGCDVAETEAGKTTMIAEFEVEQAA